MQYQHVTTSRRTIINLRNNVKFTLIDTITNWENQLKSFGHSEDIRKVIRKKRQNFWNYTLETLHAHGLNLRTKPVIYVSITCICICNFDSFDARRKKVTWKWNSYSYYSYSIYIYIYKQRQAETGKKLSQS